jgi:capsular polysaccharide biosynthesis protein
MREITLREAFRAILDRIVFVVLIPFLAIAVTALICWNVLPSTYTATTSMYVLNRTSEGVISYTDVNTSSLLVNDYQELATSNRVQSGAANVVGMADLKDFKISISTKNSTRMIYVNVEGTDPIATANVANAIAENLSTCILEVMQVGNISIIDAAVPPTEPSGPNSLQNTLLAGILGLVLSISIVIFIEVFNTRIRTADDVDNFLKLPVLAQIPKSTQS